MATTVGIIDCGIGNIGSVVNMCRKTRMSPNVITSPEQIESASKLILPGVGAFDSGMNRLAPFITSLETAVLEKKVPILGICLGAQLMTQSSEEGVCKGLGWIKATTNKFKLDGMQLKIPHTGWNWVTTPKNHTLASELSHNARFYFVHSYHFVCENENDWLFRTNYGYEFTSGFVNENIAGVQFHPEKSHRFGLQLLQNFAEWNPFRSSSDYQRTENQIPL